jgi:hypothetical protein
MKSHNIPHTLISLVLLIPVLIIILLPLHSLHLHTALHLPFLIPRNDPILAAVPQILERKFLGAPKTFNIPNPLERRIQKLFEARLAADLVEGALHGYRVGTHDGVGVYAEDGEVVVLADKIGARHDEAGAVERDFREDVAGGRGVGRFHGERGFVEGVGEDHCSGLE